MNDFPSAYRRFLPALRAKCRRILGHSQEAEDVANETFLRLWQLQTEGGAARHGSELDPRATMAWLYATCTNLAIDMLRRRRLGQRAPEGVPTASALPCCITPFELAAARQAIHRLARNIPTDQLAVAILCRVDGLPQAEAAEVLGISERTVRRLLDRFDDAAKSWRKEFAS